MSLNCVLGTEPEGYFKTVVWLLTHMKLPQNKCKPYNKSALWHQSLSKTKPKGSAIRRFTTCSG